MYLFFSSNRSKWPIRADCQNSAECLNHLKGPTFHFSKLLVHFRHCVIFNDGWVCSNTFSAKSIFNVRLLLKLNRLPGCNFSEFEKSNTFAFVCFAFALNVRFFSKLLWEFIFVDFPKVIGILACRNLFV